MLKREHCNRLIADLTAFLSTLGMAPDAVGSFISAGEPMELKTDEEVLEVLTNLSNRLEADVLSALIEAHAISASLQAVGTTTRGADTTLANLLEVVNVLRARSLKGVPSAIAHHKSTITNLFIHTAKKVTDSEIKDYLRPVRISDEERSMAWFYYGMGQLMVNGNANSVNDNYTIYTIEGQYHVGLTPFSLCLLMAYYSQSLHKSDIRTKAATCINLNYLVRATQLLTALELQGKSSYDDEDLFLLDCTRNFTPYNTFSLLVFTDKRVADVVANRIRCMVEAISSSGGRSVDANTYDTLKQFVDLCVLTANKLYEYHEVEIHKQEQDKLLEQVTPVVSDHEYVYQLGPTRSLDGVKWELEPGMEHIYRIKGIDVTTVDSMLAEEHGTSLREQIAESLFTGRPTRMIVEVLQAGRVISRSEGNAVHGTLCGLIKNNLLHSSRYESAMFINSKGIMPDNFITQIMGIDVIQLQCWFQLKKRDFVEFIISCKSNYKLDNEVAEVLKNMYDYSSGKRIEKALLRGELLDKDENIYRLKPNDGTTITMYSPVSRNFIVPDTDVSPTDVGVAATTFSGTAICTVDTVTSTSTLGHQYKQEEEDRLIFMQTMIDIGMLPKLPASVISDSAQMLSALLKLTILSQDDVTVLNHMRNVSENWKYLLKITLNNDLNVLEDGAFKLGGNTYFLPMSFVQAQGELLACNQFGVLNIIRKDEDKLRRFLDAMQAIGRLPGLLRDDFKARLNSFVLTHGDGMTALCKLHQVSKGWRYTIPLQETDQLFATDGVLSFEGVSTCYKLVTNSQFPEYEIEKMTEDDFRRARI